MELSAGEIAAVTEGSLLAGAPTARATSFAIDSRRLAAGACFVALTAARDGHDFAAHAVEQGASVLLVARPLDDTDLGDAAVVLVGDPLGALGRLGAHARAASEARRVVGITGSAGKTITKDLTAAALFTAGDVHQSPESWNNEAGVPLTLLAAPRATESIVLEMGARAPGDIAVLCDIARPTVGVITNIGTAHAGPLGGPDGIARTKGELFEALPVDGTAVLDADDAASPALSTRTRARVVRVSARDTSAVDVRATSVTLDADLRPRFRLESAWGSADVALSVHGEHQVTNALLAAAVGLDAGAPADQVGHALGLVRPADWRMEVLRAHSGLLVLNDAYNANPSSTEVALRALAHLDNGGRRIAVLGDMRELGDLSVAEHARIGRLVADLDVDVVVAVGAEAAPIAAAAQQSHPSVETHAVADADAAQQLVGALVAPNDAVLVKGSRAVGLERVARALVQLDLAGPSRRDHVS